MAPSTARHSRSRSKRRPASPPASRPPTALARYLALKGSIAVDGVSLTVNSVVDGAVACTFSVNLIPHTVENTTLRGLAVGRRVNLEADTIARYVERMLAARSP